MQGERSSPTNSDFLRMYNCIHIAERKYSLESSKVSTFFVSLTVLFICLSCKESEPVSSTNTYAITATAGANGAISPSGNVSISRGTDTTFTITPHAGYQVDSVFVDGITTYRFVHVTSDHTILVKFDLDYAEIDTIRYSQHVQPILSRYCSTPGCHTAGKHSVGLSLASWDDLIMGSIYGEAIVPFNAAKSLLINLFDGTPLRKLHPSMGSEALSIGKIDFLKRWINEDARNDVGIVPYANEVHAVSGQVM